MSRRTFGVIWRLLLVAAVGLFLCVGTTMAQGNGNGNGNGNGPNGCVVNGKTFQNCPPGLAKQSKRESARQNSVDQQIGVNKLFAGINPATANKSPLAQGPKKLATMFGAAARQAGGQKAPMANTTMAAGGIPDYFGVPNYANSPLPVVSATGAITGGMQKFVDTLPGLTPAGANNLGNFIPLASADTTTIPGSDLYRIGLTTYSQQMHSALPATRMRGYYDKNPGAIAGNHYLGPLILATRNRPVRVIFTNELTTPLDVPMDTTYMGAGMVNTDAAHNVMSSSMRADLHLHGGNTPWISDGTTHQWVTPVNDPTAIYPIPGYAKGFSFANVPDMTNLVPNTMTDGTATYYWTNEQSGRLLFYHDHAYGITRLNVYAGEAAGYLLVDPAQEIALRTATAPGTIETNPATGALVNADLAHVIPLVIQDKTFVPDNGTVGGQLAAQDPTWDMAKWGGFGSFWYPHVYTPNQNPSDTTGANGFGRWDWGPWFFPPQNPATLLGQAYACSSLATPAAGWAFPPLMCPGVPFAGATTQAKPVPDSPSGVPEGFMDTPIVNGVAYPKLTVDPVAYRFQILSVANDRTFNFGLYVADPLAISITAGGSGYVAATPPLVTVTGCSTLTSATASVDANGAVTGVSVVYPAAGPGCVAPVTVSIAAPAAGTQAFAVASLNTEVHMVPNAPAASRPATLPNCPTALEPVMSGGGLVSALLDATGNPLNGTGLPTGGTSTTPCWPLYNSTTGFTAGPMGENGALSWGNSDGRFGGVPDPTTAGPPIIQIGTEGGLLPAPVVIPSTPISYDYNKRSITVLNVLNHGLMLGAAERADVIVDFSAFAGKTLILYNDAPAPVPGADPRLDYFTGDPDFSTTGGAPSTIAGYGPNIRTIMQINVNATATTPNTIPFSLPALTAALPGIFSTSQDPIIVPEPAYPATNGLGLAEYARIQDTSLTLNSPSLLCPTGSVAAPCAFPMLPKAIQELFTLDYGRMNATLGVELPLTNFTIQTTIPYGYNDPPTEIFKDGETQVWKITHNGVDTHFIHFHLFTVQVINRVGWDGAIKPPDPNELSFKDTVRMNPLEDIIVALHPMKQSPFPFAVPNSKRPLNPTKPIGSTSAIDYTNVDPNNLPAPVINDLVNFGWEYVWHCHILGHEENDMMRQMILAVAPDVPVASVSLSAALPKKTATATVKWAETSSNYTGFTIQKSTDSTFLTGVTSVTVGPVLQWVDPNAVSTSVSTFYRVMASNLVGYTTVAGYPSVSADSLWSNVANTLAGGLLTPTVTFTGAPAAAAFNTTFTVTATTNATSMPTITAAAGSVCTVGAVTGTAASAQAVVTMTAGSGTCTLNAAWAADATYASAAAGPVVTNAILASPTVTFTGAPATAAFNGTFTVTATTSSTAIPVIASNSPLVCSATTIAGGTAASTSATVTMLLGTGTCSLSATWGATANFAAALLNQVTVAGLAAPTVSFTGAPANATIGTTYTVTATTNAGNAAGITVSASPSGLCSIVGSVNFNGTGTTTAQVSLLTGTGTCTVTASWLAVGGYAAATLSQTTVEGVAPPTVTLSPLPTTMPYGFTASVQATTNAGVMPTFTPSGACAVGAITGSAASATVPVTMTSGTGICTVTASWPATTNYSAATLSTSSTASKQPSATTITSATPNPSLVGQAVVVAFAVTGSGALQPSGGVTVSGGGATCSGVLANGAGSCTLTIPTAGQPVTLTAAYGGDANYNTSTSGVFNQTVQDFTITATPATATINGGQRQRYTVTVRSVNGFAGTVNVASAIVGGLPAGWTISGAVNLTVSAGGSASTTVTINTVKGFPGTRTINFTGKTTSGTYTLTHIATATLLTTS